MKIIIIMLSLAMIGAARAQNIFSYKTSDAEVIMLSEGQRSSGMNTLIGATEEMKTEVAPEGKYPSATNAFLIRTVSGKNVLVDTGYGRELFVNLDSVGVTPQMVDVILITHLHGDHIGGLLRDGKRAFPNAKLMMSRREADSANENTQKTIALYDNAYFEPNDTIPITAFDSIKAIACYGHTPGHTAYLVDNILIWGDLTHAMAFQMPYPQVAVTYDSNPQQAIESRQRILEKATTAKYIVGGMHIPFPGIGTLERQDNEGYVFHPLK